MKNKSALFFNHIDYIEQEIFAFYNIINNPSCVDYLLEENKINSNNKIYSDASLYLIEEDKEILIGIYISDAIKSNLTNKPPLVSLNNENINSFCQLIEELSHFHLLIERAQRERNTTKLELEWQAEIDKLIICNQLLTKQSGRNHFEPLFKMIFSNPIYTSNDLVYQEANKYAAKFMLNISKNNLHNYSEKKNLKKLLEQIYRSNWQEKISECA